MMQREGLAFFLICFELVTPNSGLAWNDNTQKLPLAARGTESRFNGQSLVKKWHVADPKMIFTKN
jgi:hypothetical protein